MAALVIAVLIAVIAFTALSIFLNKFLSGRDLAHLQAGASAQSKILPTLYTYYLADTPGMPGTAPHVLPCPDTASPPTGHHATSCSTSGTNYVGVLPWQDLGLSQKDVIDAYGNYYTYVVSGNSDGLCESITKSYATTGSSQEFTGRTLAPALEVLLTSQVAGQGRLIPFAVIGHGANGAGALTQGGVLTGTPQSTFEIANQANGSVTRSAIYSGPQALTSDTPAASYFDDQVFVPSTADIQKICAQLTPGGKVNASIADSFDNTATTAANFANVGTNGVTVSASSSDATNQDAHFAATTGVATTYLVTNSTNFNFAPAVRPVYVSAEWIAGASSVSIATRGTIADLVAGSDTFNFNATDNSGGITFRFSTNSVVILNNGNAIGTFVSTTSSGFAVTSGKAYTIEAYDNGSDVWMRITQNDNTAITATGYATGVTGDTGGTQQVFFINGASASEIDNVVIGFPMLALETSGATAGSYAATPAGPATSPNGTSTGNLTLEAWVRPRGVSSDPSGNGVIIAKWDATAALQSYRLRMTNSGQVALDVAVESGGAANTTCGTTTTLTCETYLGPSLTFNTWTHIAVTYSFDGMQTQTVSFYDDGDLYSAVSSTLLTPAAGVQDAIVRFGVGADFNNSITPADGFNGDISDVRVWNTPRTAQQINSNFQARLAANAAPSGLVVNWRLDSESGGLASQSAFVTPTSTGTQGSFGTSAGSALYVPTLAQYFRPLSTGFCPSGTIAGAYECDFRSASQSTGASPITIPNNLLGIYASVWGAGGGGYDDTMALTTSPAGGGGFSGGFIQQIGSTIIPGQQMDIIVGGHGVGSSAANNTTGGGGGGASAIRLTTGSANGLLAGGGGGASYSAGGTIDQTFLGNLISDLSSILSALGALGTGLGLPDILNYVDGYLGGSSYGVGGPGGGGGGVSALTTQAPDSSGNQCGGRGGDNGPFTMNPPTGKVCASGGNAPTSTNGGGGTSANGNLGAAGGTSAAGNGGAGYAAPTSFIGAGGGGGGYVSGAGGGGYANSVTVPANVGLLLPAFTVNEASGFGGGGGSGYADSHVTNTSGFVGLTTGDAGNKSNFYASPGNYTTTFSPGQGGLNGGNGSDGTIVILW